MFCSLHHCTLLRYLSLCGWRGSPTATWTAVPRTTYLIPTLDELGNKYCRV